ncbi:MAG: pyridoxamine 5'-phosphate oxidase family protein [Acidimicrobiales bacterium]|jgi:hypothetical protein
MGAPEPEWPDQRGSIVLSLAECHRLLVAMAGGVGRLGLVIDGMPIVLPFSYALLDDEVLLRLGPGTTLDAVLREPPVAFEIDQVDHRPPSAPEAWSVLVHGTAQVVRDPLVLEQAAASGLTPLVNQPGAVYVLVRTGVVSGRRFPVGALARFSFSTGTQST